MQRIIYYYDCKEPKKHGYKFHTPESKDSIPAPAAFEAINSLSALYVRHIITKVGVVISITDYELTEQKKQEIEQGAMNFASQYVANNSAKN